MTPVLFVDIDGVLNTLTTQHPAARDPNFKPPIVGVSEDTAHTFLERPLVKRLAALVNLAECDVVFHSGWTFSWSTSQLVTFIGRAGFHVDHACTFDSAPTNYKDRAPRVRAWLEVHGWRPFAVLDDEPRHFPTKALGRLVAVDGSVGLQDDDVNEALRLLAGWKL